MDKKYNEMRFIVVNKEHFSLLKQGMEDWNKWRRQNTQIRLDLCGANLKKADLHGANLRVANLQDANLERADLREANLSVANLRNANLEDANLIDTDLRMANLSGTILRSANLIETDLGAANLKRADLQDANINGANLRDADLRFADLRFANLCGANLRGANLRDADLTGANLVYANLIETNCENANFTQCKIFGISAWNLKLNGAVQTDLIITQDNEPIITLDNLEVAQFIYLLLHNEKLHNVIDTITSKVVLILGNFREHKAVLDAIRNELRNHDYLPVLFDFEKPKNRDLTETVSTLAHMARFIIADITEPRSIPQELQAIVPHLTVAVQPLLLEGSTGEYGMFQDLKKNRHWVLPIHYYKDVNYLLASLEEKVIAPAEAKAQELEQR